jgi:histone arginine demethylase JMJD6
MICGLTAAGDEVRVPFTDFAAYVLAQDHDAPLYLFNDEWGGAARALLSDFDPPAWAEDLLSHAPAHLRPPYRWLLVGPKRSGTLPHVDPLGTCAWNALISGEKLWVLWEPSDASVAGLVHDGAWSGVPTVCFQRLLEASEAGACALPRVFVQRPGDVVFVPAGWSHGVLNLSDTIAITENFVPSSKLAAAIAITRERRPRLGIGWERGLAKAGVEV